MSARQMLAVLAGLLCAPACAGSSVLIPAEMGGPMAVPLKSLRDLRQIATIRQQYDFSCGSAAVATLLTYHYRQPVTEQWVFEQMFIHGDQAKIRREGFSLLDMKRFLDSHGYQADGFEATLDNLASAGIPAIVLIRESGYNHFVVVKGLQEGRVLFGDPAVGIRALPRARFEKMWANRILFVIRSRREMALFNQDREWKAVPRAPLRAGLQEGADAVRLQRGPQDF
ncbi:MAG: C39 family peptidase [Zoogloea sp.]|nr:C39 family peptidase [Zoogloea sp.]